jgi:hypothetical protein
VACNTMPSISLRAICEYISAGCNTIVGALSLSATGLIAYGSHNAVLLVESQVISLSTVALLWSLEVNFDH